MYCEPGLGFLRTYGSLIKMASQHSIELAGHHGASRMPVPRFSIKILFIPQLREIYISYILLFLCPTKDFFGNLYYGSVQKYSVYTNW